MTPFPYRQSRRPAVWMLRTASWPPWISSMPWMTGTGLGLVSSSDVLAGEVEAGRRWMSPGVVLEAGVAGRVLTGRPLEAEEFFQRLSTFSDRSPRDFRTRLLQAHLDRNRSPR